MIRRSLPQWLEMIARTRPTAFAVRALEAELGKRAPSDDLSEADLGQIRAALERLSLEARDVEASPEPAASAGGAPQVSIEYRPHGRGRLYLEVVGREQLEPIESDSPHAAALDGARVYLFTDGRAFAGAQVDDAGTLPGRLEPTLEALVALERELGLPRFDCPEAGLERAGFADILFWACRNRVEAGR